MVLGRDRNHRRRIYYHFKYSAQENLMLEAFMGLGGTCIIPTWFPIIRLTPISSTPESEYHVELPKLLRR